MTNFRTALLVPLVAGLAACSSGGSDGDDPRVPDPVNGGDQAPVSLDFFSTPEGNPTEEERWEYQIETSLADSDFLTYSLASGPDSMTISEDGLVQWTPDDEDGTQVQVTVRVVYNDGTNTADAQQTFELSVTPVNDKPEITSVAPATAVAGSQFQYQLVVNDPDDANDGVNLSYTVELPFLSSQTPEEYGVSISSTGLLTWTVPVDASYALRTVGLNIRVTVTDGEEDWGDVLLAAPPRQNWYLKVVDANTPPEIVSSPVLSATEDLAYEYQLVAEDVAGLDAQGNDIADDLEYTLIDGPDDMTVSSTGLVEWTPTENGSSPYDVSVVLQVEDGGENDAEPVQQAYSITVTPVNDAPAINGTPAAVAALGGTYEYQVSVTDPDDNNDGSGLTFSLEGPEGMTISPTGFIEWTPETEGSFAVTVSVVDGQENGAAEDSISWMIEVRDNNTAPTINQSEPTITTTEDAEGFATLTAADAEGDVLAWSISEQPSNGGAIVINGAVTYTPFPNFNGTDSFTVVVTDGSLSDSVVVDVTVASVNDAPVIDQSLAVIETSEDVAGSVTLTASDVEGDSLNWTVSTGAENGTAAVVNGEITYTPDADFSGTDSFVVEVSDGTDSDTIAVAVTVADVVDAPVIDQETASITTDEDTEGNTTLTATDADGDALVWSVSVQPENGVAAVSDGNVAYTPDADFAGGDSFTVEVSDGALTDTLVVSVTINPVNDAPVFDQTSAAISTDEDTQGIVSLSASDHEGDTLTWSISTQAGNGVASATDGEITYQPSAEFSGTDSFVVAVSDGTDSTTMPVSVTVVAVNDAPFITSVAPTSATEGVEYRYAVAADDIDGDELTYSLTTAPTGMTIDTDTGLISWTPGNGDTGGLVTVEVSDGMLAIEQSYTLTVGATNDAPVITSTAPTAATEDEQYTYAPAANDPDGDTLSWSLTQSPASMTISPATGAIAWTPANGVASATVTLVVTDGALSDSETFTITVDPVNDAPVITQGESAALTTDEDQQGSLTLAATDVDNTDLTWSITGVATNGSAEVVDGEVSYEPSADFNGNDSFVVNVTDGDLSDSISVSVTVNAVNDAPVITSSAPTGAIEGTELSYQILASDVDGDSLVYNLTSGPDGMTMNATGLVTWTPENGVTDTIAEFAVSDGTETVSQIAEIQVTATNDAPVITEGDSITLTTDEDTSGSVTLNASDADGNTITWSVSEAANHGSVGVLGSGESQTITYTPDDDFNGSDSFTVQITDGIENDSITVNVTVAAINDAPEIGEGESAELTTSENTEGALELSASDIDGDSLTWSISSEATNGTATVVGGAVTYTPNAAFNGEDSFVVTVSDGTASDTITVAVSVSPVNDAPEIDQETAAITTDEDTAGSTVLTATDIDGDSLTWSISAAATNGTAAVVDGNVTYTPNADANGSDSFTVEVSDGELTDSVVVDVTVNAVNDEPVIAEGETATLNTAEDTEGTLILNASDVDGDSLTWSISAAATNGTAAVVDGVVTYQPDAGYNGPDSFTVEVSDGTAVDTIAVSVSVSSENDAPVIDQESAAISTSEDASGSTILTATDPDGDALSWTLTAAPANGSASVVDGVVTYIPDADYSGTDSLTVQVSDGVLTDSIEVTVDVTAVNDAPAFANAASTSAVEGSEYQYQAVINDVDDANNGTDLTFTLTTAPAGMAVSSTGLVTWTPANGVTSAEVVLEVADGGEDAAAVAVQSWTITVGATNDAPSIDSLPPLEATEDQLYQYDVQVSDPDDTNNGTDLTFTLLAAPAGMTVSSMGSIQWTPENGVTTADVTVQVADGGEGGVAPVEQSWTITVEPVNDAPVIDQGESAALTTTEDTTGTLDLSATDVDSETLTWSISSVATEGTASVTDGVASYVPATDFNGTDSFTVEVSDGDLTDTINVNVTVEAANDAPVFTSTAPTEATEDELYSYTAAASDTDGDALTFSLQTKPTGMTIDPESGAISWTPANGVETGAVVVAVNDGTATVTQSFVITVAPVNDAPVITSTAPTSATEDLLYSYAVVANDVDGDALTYSLTTAPTGMTISAAGVINWTPENGVASADVTVEVSDGTETDSQSFTIVVNATNDAPVITEGETATLTTAEDTSGSVTLNATDADGNALTWSISSAATQGTATVTGAGDSTSVSYAPNADFNGTDSFVVAVTDGTETDTITINVTVTAVNDAPVIGEGETASLTTAEDTTGSITLTASDIEGDSLSWTIGTAATQGTASVVDGSVSYEPNASFNGGDSFTVVVSDGTDTDTILVNVTVTPENDAPVIDQETASIATDEDTAGSTVLTASDIDGDSLTWSISAAATSGTAAVVDGNVTYTPNADVNGSDSFTVQVSDGSLTDTVVVNVTIAAVNDAPAITSSAPTSATEDLLYSYAVVANDVDGDPLTYSLTTAPTGMTISAAGVINWTPENGVASADVTVEVSDGTETDSQSFTIVVNATNDAPVITQGETTSLTAAEDSFLVTSLNATDADGNDLTWSISQQPENGTATIEGSGTGTVQAIGFRGDTNFNGTDSFVVAVTDGTETDTITVNVTVTAVNDAPVIGEGETASLTTAEDTTGSITLTATDIEGDSLSWTIGTAATQGTASVVDGNVSYEPNVSINGSDSFTVVVSDGTDTDTILVNVTVTPENDAPVIDQETASIATDEDTAGNTVLTASDVDGDSLTWSIGAAATSGTAAVVDGNVTYTPNADANGSDSFTVQVSDGSLTDTVVVDVTVAAVNDGPEITEGETAALTTDEDNAGTLTLNATDIDGDTITWSIQSQATDGSAAVAGTGASQTVTYTPAANFNGSDSFVVAITDGTDTDTITVNVTVDAANDAPVIAGGDTAELNTSEDTVGTLILNASDLEDDSLTWAISAAAGNGTATVVDGSVSYEPAADFSGSDSFTVEVSDGSLSDTIVITANVVAVNDAPVIAEGETVSLTTAEDTEGTLTLTASDVEGDSLSWTISAAAAQGMATVTGGNVSYMPNTGYNGSDSFVVQVSDGTDTDTITVNVTVTAVNNAPAIDQATASIVTDEDTVGSTTLTATDSDSETLTWSISAAATIGSATVVDGNVSYTPNANANGSDSFTVQVSDGSLTDTVVVNVTVAAVNDAPEVTEGETTVRTTNEDTALTFALNATDVDGDTLSWSISSDASEGTATVSGSGASQTVSYTPAPDFNGTDSFVVQVTDGAMTDTITVSMTVASINDLPEITSVAPVVATEGELYTYLPSATDVEGDALTWNVGTAPASMTVNPATGELNWTPAEGVTSADVTLLVNDGGSNVSQTFTITVTAVNDAPVITQGESTSVTMSEDGAPTPFTLVLNATDSDHAGSELNWSVSSAATNGTATVSGTGLSKTVNYSPDTGFSGTDNFTVEVTDGDLSDSIVVNVTVEAVNAAPVIDQGDTTTMTLDEDGTQTLSLSATDSDGDLLTWSVTSSANDGGVSVDTNGLVTYVPVADFNGSDTFTIQVSDSELTDSITVSVTVNSVNDAPVIAEGASVTLEVNEDSSDSVTFTASDADGDTLTWSISSGAVEGIVTQTGSEFSYAPAADFNGSDSFVVQVSDGTATGTSTVSVTVIAVNDAPVVTSSPVTTANEYQVYAYDVAASDAEGDAVSYSLTTAPAGMEISSAGEIRWIPESAGTYSVVVNATDGSDAGIQSFDITVNAEPAVAGRAVKGVLANASVEAAVYTGLDAEGEHSWNVIGTTTTDANGYFGFNLGTQSAPVRVRITTDAETTMVCDTPSGCLTSPPANFGESGTPAAGMILDTIVSGADFAGPLAVTPMTHMAATWLQAFPQALDDNNVLLAHKRLAVLFGFTDDTYVSQRVPDLTDAFERNFALSSDEQALRHAIFSASLQETAILASLPIDGLTENIGLIFGLLGGQMPLKSGELDVSTLGLTDPDTEEPITTISYTGFDTFVASAETVGQFINDGSLDTVIAGFGSLVTNWTPELADPSICLVTDNPELDRTECRNVTTIGEATGYDAANFARALAPIDVAGGYLDDAQAAELANGSTVNRDLGWLYVDETAQNETAEMLAGLSEVLGYGLQTAACVPQLANSQSCSVEPSVGYEAINTSISSCEGYRGDDSCTLSVSGTVNGQTYSLTSRVPDIREMLGGDRLWPADDFSAGPLRLCFNGSIANSIATMSLNNFCLILNVSDSRSDLLAPFEDLNALEYANIGTEGSAAYTAMQNLLAEVVLEIAATGALSMTSTDSNIGTYSMSNMNMSFVFDRESLVNLDKGTPVFDFEVASFSRTNPWGETLNSVSGYPMFKLQVDDTTILTGRNVKDNVGVPPTLSVTNAIVEGLGPVVDIAKEYALSMIDTTVAAPELTPEEWDAIIAEVETNLAYNGTITTTIQDPSAGDRTYIATLTPEGNVFISQENSTANAMQLYLSGATGYIYADETLVATAHLGNSQDGMLLSFVDGSQRRYTNANPNLSGQLDSFLEFLQVLVPPAEETAP